MAFAPADAPRFALSVVIEHGNAGAAEAAPLARAIMTDVLTRHGYGAPAPVATPASAEGMQAVGGAAPL